jgi:hypothetical protein
MKDKKGRYFYAAASLIVIVLGLLSRKMSDYIPNSIDSYLGDALWALMIYFIARVIFVHKEINKVAVISLIFCFLVEISQLYHAPWIDSIRKTTLGGLVLGYGFLWSDIRAYCVGVLIGFIIDKLRESKYARRSLIVSIALVFVIGITHYFNNPAKLIKENGVKEIGLYSAKTNRSLWDLGYNESDFIKADPGAGDFKFNAVFTGEAMNNVKRSLTVQSKSYRFFPDNPEEYRGLYVINLPVSKEEGITLITTSLEEESRGKFLGYRYNDKANDNIKWMVYYNKELGETLKALRERQN